MSPYTLLNRALRAEKNVTEEIVKVRDVLYLVMAALRKLPVVRGKTLYRGIRSKVDEKQYKEGRTVVWPGFSSTTPDMNTTKTFLSKTGGGSNGKNGKSSGDGNNDNNDNTGSAKSIKRIEMEDLKKKKEEDEGKGRRKGRRVLCKGDTVYH